MSESDEEAAFQSADEGDEGRKGGAATSSSSSPLVRASSKDASSSEPRRPKPPRPAAAPRRQPSSGDLQPASPASQATAPAAAAAAAAAVAGGGGSAGGGNVPNVQSPKQETIERDSGGIVANAGENPAPPDGKSVFSKLTGGGAGGGAADKNKGSGGWGSWGSWGASILNTASSSVSTFTSQVGEGFQNVLDTVESSLGAPNAEELAKEQKLVGDAKEPDETPDGHTKRSDSEDSGLTEEDGEVVGTPSEKAESEKSAKLSEGHNTPHSEGGQSGNAAPNSRPEGGAGWLSWGGISGITSMVKDTGKSLVKGGEKLFVESIDVIENTGKSLVTGGEKVIGGGLNVLESIGKKTYDVIAEGDHGLKETLRNKPNLSQILRDAKKTALEKAKMEAEYEEARKAHFGMLFDDYNGLVHLEALEAVSNQCESRVQNMLMVLGSAELDTAKHELIIMKEIFQIEEYSDDETEEPSVDVDHAFEQLATEHVGNLGLNVNATRLIEAHHKSRLWLKDCSDEQSQGVRINAKACQSLAMYDGLKKRNIAQEIHQMAIQSLAELTAVSVEQFHKVAQQLLLRQEGSYSVFKSKATCLFNLVRVIGKEVDIVAVQFTHRLNKAAEDAEEPDSVNPFITNVYLEATNSKTYIQDAFQLLLPVLQQAALQANTET